MIKSVVTGHAPVTLELAEESTPGKKHKQTKGGTRIYHKSSCLHQKHIKSVAGTQLTQFMPPPET